MGHLRQPLDRTESKIPVETLTTNSVSYKGQLEVTYKVNNKIVINSPKVTEVRLYSLKCEQNQNLPDNFLP